MEGGAVVRPPVECVPGVAVLAAVPVGPVAAEVVATEVVPVVPVAAEVVATEVVPVVPPAVVVPAWAGAGPISDVHGAAVATWRSSSRPS
jgi:hypothetical protein